MVRIVTRRRLARRLGLLANGQRGGLVRVDSSAWISGTQDPDLQILTAWIEGPADVAVEVDTRNVRVNEGRWGGLWMSAAPSLVPIPCPGRVRVQLEDFERRVVGALARSPKFRTAGNRCMAVSRGHEPVRRAMFVSVIASACVRALIDGHQARADRVRKLNGRRWTCTIPVAATTSQRPTSLVHRMDHESPNEYVPYPSLPPSPQSHACSVTN